MLPTDCLRFPSCNAPICPLDPEWRKAVHLKSEPVCPYLLGSGKAGAEGHYRDDPVFTAVRPLIGAICWKHKLISVAVERAAKSPFRGANLRKPLPLTEQPSLALTESEAQ